MRHFLITAAATAALAALQASAPANALDTWGPVKVGNQCFTVTGQSGRDAGFGSWDVCAQPASVPVAPKHHKVHHHHQ
jgi:uncharacterized membrane protein